MSQLRCIFNGLLLVVLALTASAQAVIIQPQDDPPTALSRPVDAVVGRWDTNASAVAIGPDWILTTRHHGGGVGIGFSQHAGQVIVADGTPEAAARLERVLTTDPGMGVVRHADAGYEDAIACAREHGLKLPMVDTGGAS